MPAAGVRGVRIEDGIKIALEDFEQDIFRKPDGVVVVVKRAVETSDLVAGRDDGAEIVRHHDNGECVLGADGLEELREGFLCALVDAGGGLVEEEDSWGGDQCAGDEDALLLSAGEAADGLIGEVSHAHGIESFLNLRAVGAGITSEEAFFSVKAEFDNLADGDRESPIERVALGHVADDVAFGTCGGGGHAFDTDGAGVWGERSEDEFEERTFAAAVGADDAKDGSLFDVECDVLQRGAAIIAKADIADADDILALMRA